MQKSYDPSVFEDLVGRNIKQLWAEYKAHIGGSDGTAPPAVPTHSATSKRQKFKDRLTGGGH